MTAKVNPTLPFASSWRAYLLLTLTALCWGANAVFGRLAVGEVSPMALVTFRWLTVFGLLSTFALNNVRREWAALRPRLLLLAGMGAAGFAIFNALFYMAAHFTTAVHLGIVQGAIPVFVLLGAFAAYRTPVSRLQSAGVVLTMLGVGVVASGGDWERLAALALNLGDLIMVAACLLYAGYTVGLPQRPPVSSLSLFTVLAGAALATSIPLALAEAAVGALQWPTAEGWLIIILIALFPSFLAQLFYIRGVEMIGPGRAGVFVNLVPVFAAILAVAFLREPFQAYHALALGLVIGGIWLSERGKGTGPYS